MKLRSVLIGMLVLAATACTAFPVAYYNVVCKPGDNLLAGQLYPSGTDPLDGISWATLVQYSDPAPVGTTVSTWDPSIQTYSQVSVFTDSGWSSDFTFHLGEGIRLNAPSQFTLTFVGNVYLNITGPDNPLFVPPVFSEDNGIHFLACKFPMRLDPTQDNSVWTWVIGRAPNLGEQFTWLDAAAQQYHTTTYTAGGWDNGEPSLAVGQSAFFNIGPVPEPGTVTLLAVGCAAMLRRGRKRCC